MNTKFCVKNNENLNTKKSSKINLQISVDIIDPNYTAVSFGLVPDREMTPTSEEDSPIYGGLAMELASNPDECSSDKCQTWKEE
ncbi:hypothetical protein CEXT_331111 [Caerostris extrusa]|uniref:Uncharacterized protein n=1 Tax=Caerostris extrusa TaxID=172846 RepID=A0AAV4QNT4_CAEEX|nr:hypothetical protein CEXT_331111 [Caerostris extrusa]